MEGLQSVDWGVTRGDGSGWGLPEIHNCLSTCFKSVELQVKFSTLSSPDEPSDGGVTRKLQELDGLMTAGVAVGVQGVE